MFLVNCEVFLEIIGLSLINVHAKHVKNLYFDYDVSGQFDLHILWLNAAAQTQKFYVMSIS